jgi:hypothetical protein
MFARQTEGRRSRRATPRSSRHRRPGTRLWIGALSSVLVVAGIALFAGAGSARADASPGQGSSFAQSIQVTPHEGSLAVGAVFGEALAGHTNTFARAQSQGLDLGAVGASMQGYNCGSPPNSNVADAVPTPLQTETGAQGADQGQSQSPSKSNYFSTEFVRANGDPYGEADTSFAGPVADPTNAFTVSGVHTKSWSGLVNGVNEAGATSDVSSLSLGAGTVILNGLHWEALYPTGGNPTGLFTIGQAIIAGTPLPTTQDLSAVETAVNQVLGNLGLQIQLPSSTVNQGILSVSPLQIQVVPNPTRDSLLGAGISAAQGPYYQITNGLENGFANDQPPLNAGGQVEATPPGQQLAAALCQTDTPITVLDITVAAFSGGGYFNTALGGVNATSSALAPNNYDLAALGFGSLNVAGTSQFTPGDASSLGTTGALGSPGTLGSSDSTPGGSSPGSGGQQASAAASQALGRLASLGAAAGPLLAAGLAGLGLLALLVEADRRKMRLAQRTITFEE